jgi:hypothetical protein
VTSEGEKVVGLNHPWQTGPAELFNYACELMEKGAEIDRRISFLLFDVAVETTFRTYLLLPKSVTKMNVQFADRKKYTTGTFHDLIEGVKRCTNCISDLDLSHIEFYHDIRNRLYHEGNGVTVAQKDLSGYSHAASKVLKSLLEVGLGGRTSPAPGTTTVAMEEMEDVRTQLQKRLDDLKRIASLLIEEAESKLILPSTITKLSEISGGIGVASFPKKVSDLRDLIERVILNPETRKWLLDVITDDISWDSPQVLENTNFLLEMLQDPYEFYFLILGFLYFPVDNWTVETIYRDEDFSWVGQDEYHILGIYSSAVFVVKFPRTPEEWAYNRAKELLPKMEKLFTEMHDKYLELCGGNQ